MASLSESVVLTLSSGFGASIFVRVKASAICSLSCDRRVRCLPESKGLRIQSRSPKRLVVASRIADRAGVVVCEAQKTAVEVPAVTEATWQSLVLESDLPVLVDFWAPWCGPCRMLDPIITELSKTYAGKLRCFKMNTDESPSITTEYGIRSIPTVIVFKNGEKKDAVIGAVPKSTLTASIDKFL